MSVYKIPLEAVDSTNLAALGYDPARQILAVQFRGGAIYHYAGIMPDLALQLYGAESKGGFYSAEIKGKFDGQRMDGRCPKCGDEGGGVYVGERCTDCGTADYEPILRKCRKHKVHDADCADCRERQYGKPAEEANT